MFTMSLSHLKVHGFGGIRAPPKWLQAGPLVDGKWNCNTCHQWKLKGPTPMKSDLRILYPFCRRIIFCHGLAFGCLQEVCNHFMYLIINRLLRPFPSPLSPLGLLPMPGISLSGWRRRSGSSFPPGTLGFHDSMYLARVGKADAAGHDLPFSRYQSTWAVLGVRNGRLEKKGEVMLNFFEVHWFARARK